MCKDFDIQLKSSRNGLHTSRMWYCQMLENSFAPLRPSCPQEKSDSIPSSFELKMYSDALNPYKKWLEMTLIIHYVYGMYTAYF